MLEFVKKSLAFGMGAAVLTADKLRQFADEAVERGEMSREDAKKFVDDVTNRAEEEKQSMQGWIRDQVARMGREAGFVDSDRVAALESRIASLEMRLAAMEAAEAEMPETT